MLYSNQLTNVDGLSSLASVGYDLRLDGNQLTNVNGLSTLNSVGRYFYLQDNQLENVDGLSDLTYVGNNFNLERNQLVNLDGLTNLTSLGGYLALRNNPYLTDISGISNIAGKDGQILYVSPDQYEVKANQELKFCSVTWDLRDSAGDITDDMTLVCGEGAALTDVQKLRALMDKKCSVSYSQFANNFEESTGIYSTSIDCSYRELTDEDLMKFTIVNEIQGSLSVNDNNLTNLDGLSNLTSIGGYFYLHNNHITDTSGLSNLVNIGGTLDISHNMISNLDGIYSLSTISGAIKIYYNDNLLDISGLSNITAIDGKKIYIDQVDYSVKVPLVMAMCSSVWDIYNSEENIPDDMSKLCEGYNYTPTLTDKLRDLLGKRCDIDSLTFYNRFADDSGIYNGDISCQGVQDEEMTDFSALIEVHGSFALEQGDITNLDGLIRLKKVTGELSIQSNSSLIDIAGLVNVQGVDNKKLIIDDPNQYQVKPDKASSFCNTSWDIYQGTVNSTDDLSFVCSQ